MEESKAAVAKPQLAAEQEQNLPCPRCDSTNTKFCYYNNYSRSQPRYFCKDCRRYWTRGGTLRNIPVGAGTRKNSKRSYAAAAAAAKAKRRPCSPSSAPPSALSAIPLQPDPLGVIYAPPDADHRLLDVISLAPSHGPFGSLLESFHWEASGAATSPNFGGLNPWIPAPGPELQSHSDSSAGGDENPAPPPEEDFLGLLGDPSCLAGEWPDPAINTPGSSFQ